ncbi:MAG: PadR family transcriptional regulator [Ornithinibacter sp.]
MKLAKDLVAASATPLVLAVLRRGDSYGYAILQDILAASGGRLEWTEGMMYPLLHRLESRRYIEHYQATSDAGRVRKYYRLLPAGGDHLDAQTRDFDLISSTLATLRGPYTGGIHAIT